MTTSARARRPGRTQAWLLPALSTLGILAVWQVAADSGLSEMRVIASPLSVLTSLATDPELYGTATLVTGDVALRGWIWGSLSAIVTAVLFVQIAVAERLLLRVALALFCIPEIALMPILQVALDADAARVALASIAAYFTTLVATILGLRSAPTGALQLVRAWGGGSLAGLRFVRARAAVPSILTGLQVGAPAAMLGAILGEFLGATRGLGVVLVGGLSSLNIDRVWSVALIVTLLGTAVYAGIGLLMRVLTPWSTPVATTAPIAGTSSAGGLRRVAGSIGWTSASIAIVLATWWGLILALDLSPFFAKGPVDVVEYFTTDADAAGNRATMAEALGVTLGHAGLGFTVGLVCGVLGAIAFVVVPGVERALTPVAVALRSVPIVVTIPLIIMAFGRDLLAVAVITAIVTFFPTLANTATGLRQTPREAIELLRSYDGNLGQRLLLVQLPYALPSIFASARIAAPSAMLGATLAEWLATADGLGYVIISARSHSDFDSLWAAAALLTVVSIGLYGIISAIERAVLLRFGHVQAE